MFLPSMDGVDWGMTAVSCVVSFRSGEAIGPLTVDTVKWSWVKKHMDSSLSTDKSGKKSGCAIHHKDSHNSLLIFLFTDVTQI